MSFSSCDVSSREIWKKLKCLVICEVWDEWVCGMYCFSENAIAHSFYFISLLVKATHGDRKVYGFIRNNKSFFLIFLSSLSLRLAIIHKYEFFARLKHLLWRLSVAATHNDIYKRARGDWKINVHLQKRSKKPEAFRSRKRTVFWLLSESSVIKLGMFAVCSGRRQVFIHITTSWVLLWKVFFSFLSLHGSNDRMEDAMQVSSETIFPDILGCCYSKDSSVPRFAFFFQYFSFSCMPRETQTKVEKV